MEKKKILIVDDDFGTRELIESIFVDEENYEIFKAIDAHTGRLLLDQKPDVILVDIMMPKIDGYEFIRKIRNIGPDKEVTIIVLTAKHQEQDMQEAVRAGANEFITKPFEVEYLRKRIDIQLYHQELLPETDEFSRYQGRLNFVKGKKQS